MRKRYNENFRKLLVECSLSEDLSFDFELPEDIKKMMRDIIVYRFFTLIHRFTLGKVSCFSYISLHKI
jgi:hypothetical protein